MFIPKAFADHNVNVVWNDEIDFNGVENMTGKGEIAGNSAFSPFSYYVFKSCLF